MVNGKKEKGKNLYICLKRDKNGKLMKSRQEEKGKNLYICLKKGLEQK